MLRRPLAAAIGIAVVAAAATTAVSAVRHPHDALPLTKVRDVPLPGGASRFDYQSVDVKRRRLFIAHLGAGQLVSFDLSRQRVAGLVGGLDDVRGVLVVPALGLVYAAATGKRSLVTLDERTLRRKAIAPAGDFPDGVAFDAATERVFVSDVSGEQETVFRARTGGRIGAIPLGGDPGNVQNDARTKRMLVTVGSTDELAVLDPRRLRVVQRAHLDGCEHPHGLEVASAWRRAYVACEDNATLVVVDLRSLKETGRVSVGADPDVLDLDPSSRRLYVAAESGIVAAFDVRSGIRKLGEGRVDAHAHSVAVDPRTHRVYFPLENVHGRPVLRVMRPT